MLLHLTAILFEVSRSFSYLASQVIIMYPEELNRARKHSLYPCGGSDYCPEIFLPTIPSPSWAQYPSLTFDFGLGLGICFNQYNVSRYDHRLEKHM